MRSPWNTDRNETRVLRLDPSVRVNTMLPPHRSDHWWDKLYANRVAANLERRGQSRYEPVCALLRKQA